MILCSPLQGYPTNAGDKPVSTSPPQPIKSQVLSPPLQGKGALPNSIPDHPRMFQQRDPSNLTPGTPVTPFYMNRNLTGDQLSVSHSFESNENLAPSEGKLYCTQILFSAVINEAFN